MCGSVLFVKQKTAYEMRISDWSSDVCSSDLPGDELEIYVWNEERLQRVLRVLPDGTIAFPLVGQLKVSDLLPQEVEQLVSARLQSQYRGEIGRASCRERVCQYV